MPPDIDERQRRDAKMDAVKIYPAKLKGHIKVPSSKSLSHRAIICAGLAKGESVIENLVLSEDIKATLEGMEAFGAQVKYKRPVSHVPGEPEEHCTISVKGNFVAAAQNHVTKGGSNVGAQYRTIDCRESGSTLRFLIPLACIGGGEAVIGGEGTVFTGRGRLVHRPLDEYYEIFDQQGIEYHTDGGGLPLTVKDALRPGVFRVRGDVSSQFVSGLLFALPLLDGDSAIEVTTGLESRGYVELTLDVLESFGIEVENDSFRRFQIRGNQRYQSTNYRVEGDYSQAAFWLAAGVLGGGVRCSGLSLDSAQGDRVIVDIIRRMGGQVRSGGANASRAAAGAAVAGEGAIGKPEGEIEALPSATHGTIIDASQCPDLVPVLAVLGALSRGVTRIINAKRLRVKESDRLRAISAELGKLGADVTELEDGLIIEGKETLKGGKVDSWNDHRIAMALAVASIKCTQPVVITGSGAVKKSYPHFWRDFSNLGGKTDPPPQSLF